MADPVVPLPEQPEALARTSDGRKWVTECGQKFGIGASGHVNYPDDDPWPPYICNGPKGHLRDHQNMPRIGMWLEYLGIDEPVASPVAESDLVARTRQLLAGPNVSPLPWFAHFTVHGDPTVVTDAERPAFTTIATPSTGSKDYGRANCELIAEGVSALPALLADNERLTAELATARAETETWLAKADEKLAFANEAASANVTAAEARIAQIERELRIHHYEIPGGWCNSDGFSWPCVTERALAASVVSETGDES